VTLPFYCPILFRLFASRQKHPDGLSQAEWLVKHHVGNTFQWNEIAERRKSISDQTPIACSLLIVYVERQVKARRANDATRMTLVILSRWINWRRMLTVVTGHADSVASRGGAGRGDATHRADSSQ
jgi:hypothetical protein